jgi:hypothetical protein
MKSIDHTNNQTVVDESKCCMADKIYRKLNEGSLYDIYQIFDSIDDAEERRLITQIFISRYNFDFRQYI